MKQNTQMAKPMKLHSPKNLNVEHEMDIKAVSSLLYNKLGCKGIVRVDVHINNRETLFHRNQYCTRTFKGKHSA